MDELFGLVDFFFLRQKEIAATFSSLLQYYFEIQILKSYKKQFTRLVEEGTFIASHNGELLNSKSEWHQAKVVRTTTQVIQGGAEVVRTQQVGGRGGHRGHGGGGRRGGDPDRAVGQRSLGRGTRGRAQGQ